MIKVKSSLAETRRKQKLKAAQEIVVEDFVAALFSGAIDAMEEDILEKAEAERQRLMENIAATRIKVRAVASR